MLGEPVGPGRATGIWDFPLTRVSTPSLPEVPETIELEVRTSTANGLLLWQGVVSVGLWPGVTGFSASWWAGP